jgi:hypothetical protein
MRTDNNQIIADRSERPSIEIEDGLVYKPDHSSFEGTYPDELCVQRVKKTWCTILETDFLLIPRTDFVLKKEFDPTSARYHMSCSFTSACGRYAFWRLLNEQAPEVQFLLETAHMSNRFRDYESFVESVTEPAQAQRTAWLRSVMRGIESAIESVRDLIRTRS